MELSSSDGAHWEGRCGWITSFHETTSSKRVTIRRYPCMSESWTTVSGTGALLLTSRMRRVPVRGPKAPASSAAASVAAP